MLEFLEIAIALFLLMIFVGVVLWGYQFLLGKAQDRKYYKAIDREERYRENQIKRAEQAYQNEFIKFQNDTLNVIGAAWENTPYSSTFKENKEIFRKYLCEIFEAQKPNFDGSTEDEIGTILSFIFIQTFTCSYYVLLNLQEYFPEYNINQVVFDMMEVFAELDVLSLELSDAAQEIIKNKKEIISATLKKLLHG